MMTPRTTRLLGASVLTLSLVACGQSQDSGPTGQAAPQPAAQHSANPQPALQDDAGDDQPETVPVLAQADDRQLEMTGTWEQGFDRGKTEAIEDWENGQAIIYQIGEPSPTYFHAKTSLNIEAIAGCVVTQYIHGRFDGYNKYIREQIEEHGLPDYSRLQWAEDFTYPNRAFSKDTQVYPLRPDDQPIAAPDGRRLQWVTHDDQTAELVLSDADGEPLKRFPWGGGPYDNPITLIWGPDGSDAVFIREDKPADEKFGDVYFTYDLRTGTRLGYRRGSDVLKNP